MDPVMALRQPPSPGHIHKQGPRLQQRWQDYIETEQNTVDGLLADSFKNLCKEMKENLTNNNPQQNQGYARLRSDSFSSGLSTSSRGSTATAITDLYSGSMPRSPGLTSMQRSAYSHGTLPRSQRKPTSQGPQGAKDPACLNCGNHGPQNEGFQLSSPQNTSGVSWQSRPAMTLPDHELPQSPSRRLSFSSHHIPAGIAEVEKMYTAMKNLNSPLPNAPHVDACKMPAPYSMNHHRSLDDIDQSDVASVMGEIPPPPPSVKSHAVLESGLGHQIPLAPRTPGTMRRMEGMWSKPPNMPLPPLPPKRTSSRLSDMMRPNNLNLSNDSDNSIYSRPKPFLHRSSLMSTGSSDSGASSAPSDPELPLSPLSPSSELMFTWPNYSVSAPSPTEHRSVSQIGDPDNASMCSMGNHSANTSMTSHSGVYVKMHPMTPERPVFAPENPDSEYMNLLYSAVQRQGGTGSVENAMSPYLEMTNNVKNLRNAAIDSVSAIYAQIESSRGSSEDLNSQAGGGSRGGPASLIDKQRRTHANKSKALAEFRELMLEVEKKRHFRVGLNLFNTNPDMGIDYLVKQNFIELSPLSVAKFLNKNQGLAKAKVGEYLGQLQSAFCMKVLSVFMEEFDFSGQRIDKAMRQLLDYVKVPGEAQKIEKIMEVFGKRFNKCNPSFASKLKCQESIVTLAFAIMLLNTDLHTANMKADRKMLEKEFMTNLKQADDGHDFDHKLLKSVYKGIKKQPFSSGLDHVAQTNLLQGNLTGKAPQLAESHRRLVCLCRLSEVLDINTKKDLESQNHPRDIWLFNDMMVITKAAGKSNGNHIYSYRESFPLRGMEVTLFHTPVFKYGIQVTRKTDSAVLTTLNADSEQDRYKFVMDLQESIFEMDLMERAFREANLIK